MTISEIWIYPIKSLGGIRLQEAVLTERGLQWDRRWMLLDEQGQFMTQRQITKMSMLEVSLMNDYLEVRHKRKNLSPLKIPFFTENTPEVIEAPIWDDYSTACFLNKESDDWFSEALEQNCRLVFMPEEGRRTTTGKTSGRIQKVSFADAYPILMIGQSSLDDLNSRLTTGVPMHRFRPNLVFSGGIPFEEDEWHAFTINKIPFWAEKPCSRCVLTTIDQQTGEKGKEPLATLAKYRNANGKIMFGQNLLFESGGLVKVGDPVEVISYKEAPVFRT